MRKCWSSLLLVLIVMVVTGCFSIPTGDGGSLKLSKDGVKIKSADGEEIAIDIDQSKDGMSFKGTGPDGKESILEVNTNEGEISFKGTDDNGGAIDHNVSLENDIPEGFPKEIPIPKGAEIKMNSVTETESGKMYMVNYEIEGNVIDYYNLYREYIDEAGYTDVTDSSKGTADSDTKLENILVKIDENKRLVIGIMVNGTGKYDDGSISVNMMYFE